MRVTIADLKDMIANVGLPDDAEVWIEYPERYGGPPSSGKDTDLETVRFHYNATVYDESDMLPSLTCGGDPNRKRLYIFAHI